MQTMAANMGLSPVSDIPNLQLSVHLLVYLQQNGRLYHVGVSAGLQI